MPAPSLSLDDFLAALQAFAFGYPFVMAWAWIVGGLLFWWAEERRGPAPDAPPAPSRWPRVAVLVPCRNEAEQVADTLAALARLRYPDYEIVAINDGSTDATGPILDAHRRRCPRLRVVHLQTNRGKAIALRTGALLTRAEVLVCVDGDALLDEHAVTWLVRRLQSAPRMGAVTGNPRVRNRASLLGRLQVGEFSATVGLIKRAQVVFGRLFSVSGAVCAFRRAALAEIDYWRPDVLTEDVDVTWRLQLAGWRVGFEPQALCWILMPETLRGLWRQRLRWATGGLQVLGRCGPRLLRPRAWRMWVLVGDYLASLAWALVTFGLSVTWLASFLPGVTLPVAPAGLVPQAWGLTLTAMFLLQMLVSLSLDQRYEPGVRRHLPLMIWYPLVFWVISMLTVVAGLPRALAFRARRPAVWVSPDRGFVGRS